MAEHTTDEKDEKEGRSEKQEKNEKERGEKPRNDRVSAAAWAAVLVWVGFVLLAYNLLPALAEREAWPAILVGSGVIFLLEAFVRILRPEYRRPIGGTLIFATILIAVGLGFEFSWEVIWPIALIVVGVGLIAGWATRGR